MAGWLSGYGGETRGARGWRGRGLRGFHELAFRWSYVYDKYMRIRKNKRAEKELIEDIGLEALAEKRLSGTAKVRWIPQDEVGRRLGIRRSASRKSS
jgi:hypothetical protein